jgi:hypothetical protein
MTENQGESTRMTKGAVALTLFFGMSIMIIWTLYTEFLRTKIADWSGILVTNSWFEFVIILLTGIAMIALLIRYKKVINWLDYRFFTNDDLNMKTILLAIFIFFVLIFVSGLILLSVLAFIVGTGYSLDVFNQPTMSTNESLLLLFFFILGVTVVTLAISEALKLIDYYLINDSKSELDSKKIDDIYAMLISQNTGQVQKKGSVPKDGEE